MFTTDDSNSLLFTSVVTATQASHNDTGVWDDLPVWQLAFELIYLSFLTLLGTVGNLTVIFSIILQKTVHSHGNIFVINLAVADLLVTGFIVPTVIANVWSRENTWPRLCTLVGYMTTVTCTCSVLNLSFIALNRYVAVVHHKIYADHFNKRAGLVMVAITWVWSNLLSMPPLLGWSTISYDAKMQICTWNDSATPTYSYFLVIFALAIPMLLSALAYLKLFRTIRLSGKWVRKLSTCSGVSNRSESHRRSMKKECDLLRTLAITVALFYVCWMPYGFAVLINARGIPPIPKKMFGWLGLGNSVINFIVYGLTNQVFRRGYHNLFLLLFKCERVSRTGSFYRHNYSDTFNRGRGRQSRESYRKHDMIVRHPEENENKPSLFLRDNNNDKDLKTLRQYRVQPHPVRFLGGDDTKWSMGKTIIICDSTEKLTLDEPADCEKIMRNGVSKPVRSVTSSNRNNDMKSAERSRDEVENLKREQRMKRNSLMLLQIEVSEDDSPIHRTHSSPSLFHPHFREHYPLFHSCSPLHPTSPLGDDF